MASPKDLDTRAMAILLVLCTTWALQQIVMKAVAADMPVMLQIALRSILAALMIGALMAWRREGLHLSAGRWRAALAVALLFGIEFVFIGEGLRHTSAGHMVVFLYTAPVFAALGLHLHAPAERLRPAQWQGMALAFAGIALAFGWRGAAGADAGADALGVTLYGDALALLAGAAWGFTTVVVRGSWLARAPATETLLYQLLGAGVIVSAAALWTQQTRAHFTAPVIGSLAFQTLGIAFASYLTWFWLMRRYQAAQMGVFTFLTPLLGVALGAWLLSEPLEPAFVGGAVLVLAGITRVNGVALRRRSGV